MSHLRPQLAILLGAFALAVLISLVASTPAFYQSLSLAAHAMPDTAATGASAPSTAQAKVAALEAENAALKAELAALRAQVQAS
ncbi:MAG: hypothetical protein VXW25_05680 [Pseudomonadota bacterium]|nr:hypothetical protein [Pseudomonadota bacterium]